MNCVSIPKPCWKSNTETTHQKGVNLMTEGEPRSFPTNSVAKEDLLYCRPDLKQQIEALNDSDVERIASKVGETLQEQYWMALKILLAAHLNVPEIWDAYGEDEDDEIDNPAIFP